MYLLLTIFISAASLFCILILPVALEFFLGGLTNHTMQTQMLVSAGIVSVAMVIACTLLAVSPAGEWMMRLLLGARKLVGREQETLVPLLESLKEEAGKKGKTVHIRPYIVDDPYPRRTSKAVSRHFEGM